MSGFRTARGHDSGAALTFVTPAEEGLLGELEARLKGAGSEASGSSLIKPYKFHMSEIEGFRYRVKVRLVRGGAGLVGQWFLLGLIAVAEVEG